MKSTRNSRFAQPCRRRPNHDVFVDTGGQSRSICSDHKAVYSLGGPAIGPATTESTPVVQRWEWRSRPLRTGSQSRRVSVLFTLKITPKCPSRSRSASRGNLPRRSSLWPELRPELIRRFGPDGETFGGLSFSAHVMVWPRRNIGWFAEARYELAFPHDGTKKSVSFAAGLLIGH